MQMISNSTRNHHGQGDEGSLHFPVMADDYWPHLTPVPTQTPCYVFSERCCDRRTSSHSNKLIQGDVAPVVISTAQTITNAEYVRPMKQNRKDVFVLCCLQPCLQAPTKSPVMAAPFKTTPPDSC